MKVNPHSTPSRVAHLTIIGQKQTLRALIPTEKASTAAMASWAIQLTVSGWQCKSQQQTQIPAGYVS